MINNICQKLIYSIQNRIAEQGGRITFAEYMQLAMYAPGLGYYSSGTQKFGRSGDFVTAPEIGSLFAQCVAKQCRQILPSLPQKNILEIGAGSGQLAMDLCNALGSDLDQYYILELSAELQERQRAKVPNAIFLSTLPENFTGIVIANEVMDAMPVAKFHYDKIRGLREYYVTADFKFVLDTPTTGLSKYFDAAQIALILDDDYTSEVNLFLPDWIKSLSMCMQQGAILLFDYGFPRTQYYHPQRNTGTLMCHYQHKCNFDPLYLPGQQDITAHVDFTAVAEAATDNDLEIAGFVNLAAFLLNCGLTQLVTDPLRQAAQINTLTSAAEMGELFKVIGLVKSLDIEAIGFANYDRTHCL